MRRVSRIGLLLIFLALPEGLRGESPAVDFNDVAKEVRADLKQAENEQALVLEEVSSKRQTMQQQRDALESRILREKARLAKAHARLAVIDRELQNIMKQVGSEEGDLNLVADTIRSHAAELLSLVRRLPVTAEEPGQLKELETCMDKSRFPGLEEIRSLFRIYFRELDAASRIWGADTVFVNEHGEDARGRALFLGGITATYEDAKGDTGYLALGPQTGRLIVAARPPWYVRHNIRAYMDGEADGVFTDISGGSALKRLARSISPWHQFLSGGPLIWPICLVGLAALILVLERIVFLRKVRTNTDALMVEVTKRVQAGDLETAIAESKRHEGQPTGNVLLAGLEQKGQPRDVIESSLSEAILREMPRLERFLPVLKMLAAIAPLLGLLGTVTGMISTFQVITVYGGGDPKLMSGGISEALVTTELGLAVAIPILIATTLLAQKVKAVVSDMREKAVALTAVLLRQPAGGDT